MRGTGGVLSAAIVASVVAAGATAYAAHSAAASANKARQQAAAPTTTTSTSGQVRGTPAVQAAEAAALPQAGNIFQQELAAINALGPTGAPAGGGGRGGRGGGGGGGGANAGDLSTMLANLLAGKAQQPVANMGNAENYVASVLGGAPPGGSTALPSITDLPPNLQAQVKSGKMTLDQAVQQAIANRPAFAAKFAGAVNAAAGGGGGSAASNALAYNPVAQGLYNAVTSPTGALSQDEQGLQAFYDKGGGATPAGLGQFLQTGQMADATDPNSALGKYEAEVLNDNYLNPSTNPALAGVMKAISDQEQQQLNQQLGTFDSGALKMGMFGSSGAAVGQQALERNALQDMADQEAKVQEDEFNQGRALQEQVAGLENSANTAGLQAGMAARGQNLSALDSESKDVQTGLGIQSQLGGQLSKDRQDAVGDVGTLSAAGLQPAVDAWNAAHGNDEFRAQMAQIAASKANAQAQLGMERALLPGQALGGYLGDLNLLGGQNVSDSSTSTQTHDPSAAGATDPTAAAITGGLGGGLTALGLLGQNNSPGGQDPNGATGGGIAATYDSSGNMYDAAGNVVGQFDPNYQAPMPGSTG